MPPATAQWRSDRDAEICVTGAGARDLDIAVCGRALARDDLSELDRASAHIARGKALRDEGRLSAALSRYDANISTFRGFLDYMDGRYRDAAADFERVLLAESHFYLAALDRLHGRSNKEREHLDSVMAIAAHRMPERVLAEAALRAPPPVAPLNRP